MNIHKKIIMLCWNIRGLGDINKCKVVRDAIRSSRCDVVLYQETKWNKVELSYMCALYPSYFDKNIVCTNAPNSAGGYLIAWNRSL
jgi:exonuclease III